MTLTLHTQNKMAGGSDDLYLFGEDFDAILDILKEDEGLKEQFESSASDVCIKLGVIIDYAVRSPCLPLKNTPPQD